MINGLNFYYSRNIGQGLKPVTNKKTANGLKPVGNKQKADGLKPIRIGGSYKKHGKGLEILQWI